MVQAESMQSYGTVGGGAVRREARQDFDLRTVTPKMAGMMALALAAVVCVAVTSNQMGAVELEEQQLHSRTSFSVADAILKSADVHDKKGSIPASIAALAAQAAREKETGQLTATVELPQIPKKIAAMAAEAKHEILIERSVDKKKKAKKQAAEAAKKAKAASAKLKLAEKKAKAEGKKKEAAQADIKKVQAAAKLAKKHIDSGSNKLASRLTKWEHGASKTKASKAK
jgi:colicin import membrane protein